MNTNIKAIFAGLVLLLVSRNLQALDHRNLDAHFPVTLEDAYPIKFREMAFQAMFGYQRLSDSRNSGDVLAEWEYGLIRNMQLTVSGTYLAQDGTQDGELGFDVLYNFNTETMNMPAFAVKAGAEFPVDDDQNAELFIGGIVSRTFGVSRIHLNGGYTFVNTSSSEEREGRWEGIAGMDHPFGLQSLIIVDVVARQSERQGGSVVSRLEFGFRRQLTPDWILNAAIGAGLSGDEEKEAFFVDFGFSKSF